VLYINPADGGVWQINIDGSGQRKVLQANLTAPSAWLLVCRSTEESRFDLCVAKHSSSEAQPLRKGFISVGGLVDRNAEAMSQGKEYSWQPIDLRGPAKPNWTVGTVRTADVGIFIYEPDHTRYHLALATPVLSWTCDSPTILPTGQVLFQLEDQIVILDVETRRLGFLVMGRGPVVVPGMMGTE
jgi:hypothetical protein